MKLKRQSFFKRIVISTLLATMITSSLPAKSGAETVIPAKDADAKFIPTEASVGSVEEPTVGEVVSERTENTKTFYNGDGEFTKKIYFEPIHVKDSSSSEFENISTDLVENPIDSNVIETENTKLETSFLSKMENGEYASFNYKNQAISFSVLEAYGDGVGTINANDVEASYKEENNQIFHKNIFPDIDLRNFVFNQNTKEDIILNSYKGYHQFTFKIQTDLTPTKLEDDSISFVDDSNKEIFNVPAPTMTDSNYDEHSGEAVRSNDVTYSLEKIDGGYKLIVNADQKWLEDPSRKYPVFIDPTTSISISSDTYVSSATPTTNYEAVSSKWDEALGEYVLRAGYYSSSTGTNYAYLINPISSIDGLNVTGATLYAYVTHHYYADSTPNGLWVDRNDATLSPNSVTWNTKPSSTNIATVNVGINQWATFNVTSTVKGWADGSIPNYGFKLHTNGNGQTFWKKIVSSANTTNKPYLSVAYTIPTPNAPSSKIYSTGNGTGYVDLSWDKVKGATGYSVWIYNGISYEEFPVKGDGNTTTWSTKALRIWPTATGRYALHHDKMGAELPLDPSKVYENSGGVYPTNKNYWFRISANYELGKSAMSNPSTPTMLPVPSPPTGRAYTNVSSSQSGYVNLNWPKISGATGYKVWLFNGKTYEAYDVGDTDSWTTQNKGIWPKQSEIDAGMKALHHPVNSTDTNYGGTELPMDPSKLYSKTGTGYATSPYYFFRISAYNDEGETVYSTDMNETVKSPDPNGFKIRVLSVFRQTYSKTTNLVFKKD